MDFSQIFVLSNLPVLLLCVALIAAAVIDYRKLKVPNKLTFPMIFTGWAFGLVATLCGWTGGLGAAVLLTFAGLGLLLPVYMIGGMGAGDVKMQMGFGAWLGALYGLGQGWLILWWAFCTAAIVGGVIALGMMFWRGDFFQNRKNVADIVRDWFSSASIKEVADKAAERKPRMHLLPYGVPLCIGYLGYMFFGGFLMK
jgi:prepilin peptidase CpaA